MSTILWGSELWDQWKEIEAHTKDGLDFVAKCSEFVKKRAQIEVDYARSLQKLTKSYFPAESKGTKKKSDERTTLMKAWIGLLNETDDISKQHEVLAEELTNNVFQPLKNISKDIEKQRKQLIADGDKLKQDLLKAQKNLEQAQKNYQKLSKEAETARVAFEKADKDLNVTKADLDKLRETSLSKTQKAVESEELYRRTLQETNMKQAAHYSDDMASTINYIQKMEEERIQGVQLTFQAYQVAQANIVPIIKACLENMEAVTGAIDSKRDNLMFLEDHRTGAPFPSDKQFEAYSVAPPASTSEFYVDQKPRRMFYGWKTKGDEGQPNRPLSPTFFRPLSPPPFPSFSTNDSSSSLSSVPSTLTTATGKRGILAQIDDLETELDYLNKSKKGLENLVGVYASQSDFSDSKSKDASSRGLEEVNNRIVDATQSLQKLREHLAAATAPQETTGGLEGVAIYDFEATSPEQLSVKEGQRLRILLQNDDGWWLCKVGDVEGFVRYNFIELL